jgi:hypothetical protein
MPASTYAALYSLWQARDRRDEYIGTLVNAYIAAGGAALGVKAGEAYVDVGTVHGYRAAIRLLAEMSERDPTAAGSMWRADGGDERLIFQAGPPQTRV